MSLQLRLEIDGVNAGQGGADYLLSEAVGGFGGPWKVESDGPGRIGTAHFSLLAWDRGDLALHNQSYCTLGLFDTDANRYTRHLWCGIAAVPEVGQLPGTLNKTWALDCQGLGVEGKALVSDAGGPYHVRIAAGTFAAQITALCTAWAAGAATHTIDGSSHVLNLTGPALLPPLDGAGLAFETILGTIFANAQKLNPALVPVWVITPDPDIGAVGGGFADPVLWVWDSAALHPAVVAAYSTTPDLTHFPILPQTPYARRLESPELVNYRQSIGTTGLVYTASDPASIAAHPNPFDPRGVWAAAALHDTTNTGTGIHATAHATVSGGAVTAVVMNLPGNGYPQAPTVGFTGGGGSGAAGLAVMYGHVLSILVTAGGSGYVTAPRVVLTGGGGTGAEAQALLIGDAVGAVTVTAQGSGYTSVPGISFVGGSGATATAGVSGGHVTTVLVTAGGTNYTAAPAITFSGGGGTGAAAHATLGGSVLDAPVSYGGTGYTTTPTVTFTGGGGTGATATAAIDPPSGQVTRITITAGGTGYTSAPTVHVTGGGGSGATASATIGGSVVSVALDAAGTGYATPPTVGFNAGSGAAATAQIGGQVASVTVTSGGTGYATAPTVTFADAVQQALDAAIRPVSQPSENVKVLVDVPAPVGAWVTLTLDVVAGLVDRPYAVVSLAPDYSVFGPDHPVYQLECGSLRLRPGETASGAGGAPVEGVRLSPPQNFAQSSHFLPDQGNTEVDYTWVQPPAPPGARIIRQVVTVQINTGTYNHEVAGTAAACTDYVNPGEHIYSAFVTAYDQNNIPSWPSNTLAFDAAGVIQPDPPTALRVVSRGVHPQTGLGWAIIGWTRPAVPPSAYQLDWYVKGVYRGTAPPILGTATQSGMLEGLPPQAPITIQMRSYYFPNYYGLWASPPLTFTIPWLGPPPPPPDQPGTDGVLAEWTADDESVLALAPDVTYHAAASVALSPAPGGTVTLAADAVQTVTPGAWVQYGIAAALLDGDTDTAAEYDLIWGDGAGTPLRTTAIPLTPLPSGVTLSDDSGDVLTDDDGTILTTLPDLGTWEDQMQVPLTPPGIKTLVQAVLITASLTLAGTVYAEPYIPARPALTAPAYTPASVTTPALADGTVSTAKIAAGAVTGGKIGPGAVGTTHLADSAVSTLKIADGAATTAKLADSAVSTAKLADGAATSSKIADGAVLTAKLAAGAVTSAKIAAGAVGDTQIGQITDPSKLAIHTGPGGGFDVYDNLGNLRGRLYYDSSGLLRLLPIITGGVNVGSELSSTWGDSLFVGDPASSGGITITPAGGAVVTINNGVYSSADGSAGSTEDVTIAGVVYHYKNGLLVGHTP